MIVNLTSHPLNVVCLKSEPKRHHGKILAARSEVEVVQSIEPSGQLARTRKNSQVIGHLFGMPVRQVSAFSLEGLPEPDGSTVYIVAGQVAEEAANSGRTTADLISPHMIVRDVENNQVILGTLGFQTIGTAPVIQGESRPLRKRPKTALPDRPICSLMAFPVKMVQVSALEEEDAASDLLYAEPCSTRELATLAPSGHTARCALNRSKTVQMHGLNVHSVSYGRLNQLPAPDGKTIFVVSGGVLRRAAAEGRPTDDLVAPGGLVRLRSDESASLGQLYLDTLTGRTGLLGSLLTA